MIVTTNLQQQPPGCPTAVTLGCFDGVHLGHQAVIGRAVEAGRAQGLLPAVFTFTLGRDRPQGKAGAGRLVSDTMKDAVLEALGVEYVCSPDFDAFREMSPQAFVQDLLLDHLQAKVLVCGYDFHFGHLAAGNPQLLRELCQPRGVQVLVVPPVQLAGEPVSSTRIRQAVSQGEMELARTLLGRPYGLDFPIVQGNHLGRKLQFPTINQPFPPDFVLPRFGVYGTLAQVEGRWYPAVTNVGVKPTIGTDTPLAETYLQGYSGDLYGRRVLVELLSFLRPERKFPNVEALREQIARDARQAQEMGQGELARRQGESR